MSVILAQSPCPGKTLHIWLENSSPKLPIEKVMMNNFKVFLHKMYLKILIIPFGQV